MGEPRVEPLELVRVRNPEPFASADPLVREHLDGVLAIAFHGEQFAEPESVRAWLADEVADDAVALFLAYRGDAFVALGLIVDRPGPFSRYPFVLHIYAPKDREARIAVAGVMADWARARGYDRVAALNQSGMDDAVWLTAFKPVAAGKVVASYVEFDLGGT